MKKIIYLAGCALLTLALCGACSIENGNDNGNDNGNGEGTHNEPEKSEVVLDTGTETEQVVFADEMGIKDGNIRFTTQGPWKAEVEDVTTKSEAAETGTVDWLTLSQYSGEQAGDYTITLNIRQNFTGKSRKAEIRIICGKTVIIITIEQKAEKEDGGKLKRVKSVYYTEIYGPEDAKRNGEGDKADYTYSYDEEDRVAEVTEEWNDYYAGESHAFKFDYNVAGEITVTDGDNKYLLSLNDQGNVRHIVQTEEGEYSTESVDTQVEYTEDGRLAKLYEKYEEHDYNWYQEFFYTDGLLTKAELEDTSKDIYEFKINEAYPNRYPVAGSNIDFNEFLYEVGINDIEGILFQIGLLGKGSECLLEIGGVGIFVPEEALPEEGTYTEPGKVYEKTEKVLKYTNKDGIFPVMYAFDGDKYVTKFSYTEPYEVYEHYYEIHVSQELLHPEHPEMGYKYEIKNEEWNKLCSEENTYTYTVTYE